MTRPITVAGLRLMTRDQLERVRVRALDSLRRATAPGDANQREHWSRLLVACDEELGKRSDRPEGQGLAERLDGARAAIYGPARGQTDAEKRAAALRPQMEAARSRMAGKAPESSDEVRERARKVAQELRGVKP